ncbi:LINE-1 reverse transcriptase-like protein [Bienertia sinuspersici]
MIHMEVQPCSGASSFYCSFVYAHNTANERKGLWDDLRRYKRNYEGPWLLMGDINCVLDYGERLGSMVRQHEIDPGKTYFEECGLSDIAYTGAYYTWSNKQEAEGRVYSKLDRIMANDQWVNLFSTEQAVFLPAGISDHSPGVLMGNNTVGKGIKPFKYFNMWSTALDYKERIKRGWNQEYQGCLMFQLRQKLKAIKQELKELNRLQFSNIHLETEDAHNSLLQIQKELQDNPSNSELCTKERKVTELYKKKLHYYVQFLQQKARIKWWQEGDDNTALFHRSLRAQRLRSNLYSIYNMQGQLQHDPNSVSKAFLDYYEHLIGTTDEGGREQVLQEVVEVGPRLSATQQERLIAPFTSAEVKDAIFSMDGSKAPGPDGFNAQFYKENWDIIGEMVIKSVMEFFQKGKLLKEINSTFISLIPKIDRPQNVSEFRPIACCNVIYKCITKMICA